MAERIVHEFPPGEYTRVRLLHDRSAGSDPRRSLAYLITNRGMGNGGVVLVRMSRVDLMALRDAIDQELCPS